MQVKIHLAESGQRELVLRSLIRIIKNSDQIQAQLKTQGILVELIAPSEVTAIKQKFTDLDYTHYIATDTTFRLLTNDNGLEALTRVLVSLLLANDNIAKLLWERGLILEDITPRLATAIKRELEAKSAQVTITNAMQYTVTGQVRRTSDNAPFSDSTYTLRAYDSIPGANLVPLGKPTKLTANGTYRINYAWESTGGRNGPNLLVVLLDPDGQTIAQATKPFAERQEILNLTVELPAPRTYTITGIVKDQTAGNTLPNVNITASFQANGETLATQTQQTNDQGKFKLTFQQRLVANQSVEVTFQLSQNSQPLQTTTTIPNLQSRNQTVEILTTVPTPTDPPFIVRGTIRQAEGSPMSGMTVRAFDRDLRAEQFLGEQTTNANGYYEISYTRAQFRRADKGSADLVVRLFTANGEAISSVALTSDDGSPIEELTYLDSRGNTIAIPVWFNAPPVATINGTLVNDLLQDLPLYDQILREISPTLAEIPIAELNEPDLAFLAAETAFEKALLGRFILSHRLAQQAIQPEFWFVLLGGSFYEYRQDRQLEEQLTNILNALPTLNRATVNKALVMGFNQEEISEDFKGSADDWIEAFLKFAAQQTIRDAAPDPFVKQALEDASIRDTNKQEKFAQLFNKYQAVTPELITALEEDSAFSTTEITDLNTSFQLSNLTQGDFSVVKAIKEDFGVRQPEQVRILAKRSEQEWINLVTRRQAAGDITLPIETRALAGELQLPEAEVYGSMLERQFREAFPTTAFSGGLTRALQNGGSRGLRNPRDLNRFLERYEQFELLQTPVDEFLDQNIDSDLRPLATNPDFRLEVKAVQRVFKLAPTFEATDALLADDLHSAQKIYRLGKSEFVRRYADRPGFTPETARLAWNRAADTHAAVLTIVADLKAFETDALPFALKTDSDALSNFPNWNNLFKAGDLCECEHCCSVLSPAAYFADLLMFLGDRPARNPANSVKDILFNRRPDLGYLELNCDNALVPFPYIDTVCEVLEAAIDPTGENDLELVGFTAVPNDPITAQTAVIAALEAAFDDAVNDGKQKIALGSNLSLSQLTTPPLDRWVVHTDDVTYLLKKKPSSANYFAEVLRNTKASAEELRAYPQYVNPKVYDTLKQARYPLALPFDLFAAEVRAALQKTNLQRWDLMQAFQETTPPNDPSAGEIAAEYFGISVSANPADPSEKDLILVASPSVAEQQIRWGESAANWLDTVSNVKIFLQKTRLTYTQLLALLDLPFINPSGDLSIQHLDASCDLDQKRILGLDPASLDRIHRFLRLWHKLTNWKMWELDLVIRHPNIGGGSLNESFLVSLFYFSQLRQKLGSKTTVEQVCALLGDLNTETRFTELHKKREEGLYQSLFLNKRLINPLDLAFQIDQLSSGEIITDHHPVILATLGIREADLILLKELTRASDGTQYITDELTLENLSFLWRHAWLAKMLKFKVEEWAIILNLVQEDIQAFAGPQETWEFVETLDHLKATKFKPDELNWLLAGDRTAKAATKESDAIRFLTGLRTELQSIKAEYDPNQYDFLSATPPTDVESLTALLTSLLQTLNRDEADTQFFLDTLRDEVSQEQPVAGLPVGFSFPATITNDIRISYSEPSATLRFTGLMTQDQQDTLLTSPSLAAITGIAAYQEAIEALFLRPRLALKFFEPKFTAPLAALPTEVDFSTLADPNLAQKISYDVEQRLLQVTGILSPEEQTALDNLSADPDYRNAVNSLATQPEMIAAPDDRIWLLESDLQFPLRDLQDPPTNDHLAENLAITIPKALAYLSKTRSEGAVIQQSSAQLGLTEALTRYLMTQYALLPDTLLIHFTDTFANTAGLVDYATLKQTFDGWYWAHRVATLLTKWKITLADLEKITTLTSGAQLLDFQTLPLDEMGAIASLDRFLRTSRLLKLRDSLPETNITLFEVLEKLNQESLSPGAYAETDFADDIELLNEAWLAIDVVTLTNILDLTYPADYLLAETWERLRRAFYFIDTLNATAETVQRFAAAAMGPEDAMILKELLRSKFGVETWLTLSAEIQDVLREHKRDALAAYLLTQPQPSDAPSGKWENTNDLYAYYLLDIEMSSCQLTSRLVQGSGSIQLFVQRCLMGLEPDVVVKADGDDGDSAWRWWQWMRKYRVWEANRKVFLWPENWIEPELKKDRSSFFKDLENELLQNEINQYNVETAFTNYLEKLDEVAQLEIAGFYQEDDGDNTIIHVFGRTSEAEPHIYYYRRYDYRQWTPWEKVDLDIQGNYLIPAVVNKRLFLFWPIFTEVPDEAENSTVNLPTTEDQNEGSFKPDKTQKRLQLQMAVSDYRQGKWTPKRISKDAYESLPYSGELIKNRYRFYFVDRSDIDGRVEIQFREYGKLQNPLSQYSDIAAGLFGAFEMAGCSGLPKLTRDSGYFEPVLRPEAASVGFDPTFLNWVELSSNPPRFDAPQEDDFTLFTGRVLTQTPGLFKMTPPWHLSYFDKLWLSGIVWNGGDNSDNFDTHVGTWSSFFYNNRCKNKRRTFFVLPSFSWTGRYSRSNRMNEGIRYYYPDIKAAFRQWESLLEGAVHTWVDDFDLSTLTATERQQIEQDFQRILSLEATPPYSDEQLKELAKRGFMMPFQGYLGILSWAFFNSRLRQLHFKNFYHPFVCNFAKLVHNPLKGIPALMSRETQLQDSGFSFRQVHVPTNAVVELPPQYPSLPDCYPRENVDFTPDGAYSPYNWELFFHAPLLIANSLSKNQRFEEARDWYHYIFNPIGVDGAGGSPISKYWITKPFFETTDQQYIQQRIENLLRMLSGDTNIPGFSEQAKKELEDQVLDWRTNPFEPHRIANYRTVAYQKTVVMKYLDNLIDWGDYLFRQDSMESINEATQLYILAAEILGPKPQKVPSQALPPVESFNELENEFDAFSNALVEVENLVPVLPGDGQDGADSAPLPMLYFCIPHNDKMLGYWDTVADRLYKIRNCMNIEGVVRQLALFEPPIDPGALVKAVAGGVDISSALADLNAPLPLYRFNVLLQKANEVCNDVKSLGNALISALEKKDTEALSLLRQGQEIRLLEAVKAVREQQIEEAKKNLDGLKKNKELVTVRRDYYLNIEKINASETLNQQKLRKALTWQQTAQGINISASVAHAVPSFDLGISGFGGSPKAAVMFGGPNIGNALQAFSGGFTVLANIENYEANKASINAGHDRRWDDWKFQENLADKELEQLDEQISAAELRIQIAEKELDNHIVQIENAKASDEFMRSKYTNEELYQWQIGQISGVYFQSYRLAYDLAKRAERCFRFELGLQDSSYIQFGYWDSLKKGLLSGERLQYDLHRLETAYLEQNRREFELTKHVSLALLAPLELVQLRETGRCFFTFPEEIFDLDYSGHYFRCIKSVSLTLPCVVGPYTTVACTLRLLKNSIRINTSNGDNGYPRNTDDQGVPTNDDRFIENNIPVKAIATSNAQNDSGVFELNFQDARYLPFEGAGAISEWSLELFHDSNNPDFGKDLRQFDYSTITDAILHIRYMAREDAGPFKNGAVTHLREYFAQDEATPSMRMFNIRQEFPSQWHRFLNPTDPADGNVFELEMSQNLFPIRDQDKTLKINSIVLLARCTDPGDYEVIITPLMPEPPTSLGPITLAQNANYGGLHVGEESTAALGIEITPSADPPVKWQLSMSRPAGNIGEEVRDLMLVLGYEWE